MQMLGFGHYCFSQNEYDSEMKVTNSKEQRTLKIMNSKEPRTLKVINSKEQETLTVMNYIEQRKRMFQHKSS